MKGISLERINYVKDINLIQYVIDNYNDKFYQRKNGELVYRLNRSLVIYADHAYDFSVVKHAYKDSIYIEEFLSGCTFSEAVERIEVWKKSKEADESGSVRIDIFNNLSSVQPEEQKELDGLMNIPDGIDRLTNDE